MDDLESFTNMNKATDYLVFHLKLIEVKWPEKGQMKQVINVYLTEQSKQELGKGFTNE